MAEHANITPTTQKPIVDPTTPRKQAEDALYEAGVITDILRKLATLMISSSEEVCGTSFDWLTEQLEKRHEAIRELISTGSFGRGA